MAHVIIVVNLVPIGCWKWSLLLSGNTAGLRPEASALRIRYHSTSNANTTTLLPLETEAITWPSPPWMQCWTPIATACLKLPLAAGGDRYMRLSILSFLCGVSPLGGATLRTIGGSWYQVACGIMWTLSGFDALRIIHAPPEVPE